MNVSKVNRWLLFSGIAFVALYVYVSIPKGDLGFLAEPEAVAAFYAGSSALFWWHGYLGMLAGVLLLLFVGSVRSVLQETDPGVAGWADLAFGGGTAAGALALAGFAIQPVLAERAGTAAGFSPEAATAMSDIVGSLTGMALPIAFAVFVGATGLALIRSKLLPAWFGWLSVILAAAMASPAMYLTVVGGWLWTIVVALWLFARTRNSTDRTAELATPGPA